MANGPSAGQPFRLGRSGAAACRHQVAADHRRPTRLDRNSRRAGVQQLKFANATLQGVVREHGQMCVHELERELSLVGPLGRVVSVDDKLELQTISYIHILSGTRN